MERVPIVVDDASQSSNESGNEARLVGKPKLKETEADIARDRHDYFNLIALVCAQVLPRFA
jgi:hypothetical protein